MKRPRLKWLAAVAGSAIAVLAVFCVIASAVSPRFRHQLNRTEVKGRIAWSKLWGYPPRIISLTGNAGVAGAEVQVLDSKSGWATISDKDGRFTLPGELWYLNADYTVLVSVDGKTASSANVTIPNQPSNDTADIGTLSFSENLTLDHMPGVNSVTELKFDSINRDYYRQLYAKLVAGKTGDVDKLDAVNLFVADKLNYANSALEASSPRQVVDDGSRYCTQLALLMAALAASEYPVRILHLEDYKTPPDTHAIVEVYYQGGWHLFDPTYGTRFADPSGNIYSYRDLALNPDLVTEESFSRYLQKYPKASLSWMQAIYRTAAHHYFVWRQ